MSKVVRVSDNDYRIITAQGGQITLDTTNNTGNGSGKVVVNGDLEVKGDTTTVHSTVTTITDNILVLSKVEGTGVQGLSGTLDRPYSSGIEIDRGDFPPVRWVYDETISWDLGGESGTGAFLSERGWLGTATLLPIRTPGIIAAGNLYVNVGVGVISVTGSDRYEEKVFRYENGALTPDQFGNSVVDDDHIPNAKAVRDFVAYSTQNVSVSRLTQDNSKVEVIDKNTYISSIVNVGVTTIIATPIPHGYVTGDSITIQGVISSNPFITALNGTWLVEDIPSDSTIEIARDTTGGDPSAYVSMSGSIVSSESKVAITVEGSNIANFYSNRLDIGSLAIIDNTLQTTASNTDLVIKSSGTGSVKIDDNLLMTKTPGDDDGSLIPSAPTNGIKVFSNDPGEGGSGLYFVNENTVTGEFISKNRALLFSMLF